MWVEVQDINYDAVTVEDCELMAENGRYAVINDGKLEGFVEEK